MTGRKSVVGAMAGGIFGMENRKCLKIELKTRNCTCISRSSSAQRKGPSLEDMIRLTCHAHGTLFKLNRIRRVNNIRDTFPGPVYVVLSSLEILTLDTVTPATSVMVKASDFMGRRTADAMVRECSATNKKDEDSGY